MHPEASQQCLPPPHLDILVLPKLAAGNRLFQPSLLLRCAGGPAIAGCARALSASTGPHLLHAADHVDGLGGQHIVSLWR